MKWLHFPNVFAHFSVSFQSCLLVDVASQTGGGCIAKIILEKLIENLGKYSAIFCRRSRVVVCVFCAMSTQAWWTSLSTTKTENLHKFSLVLPETRTRWHPYADFSAMNFKWREKQKDFGWESIPLCGGTHDLLLLANNNGVHSSNLI